jgi:hypothetical protein
MDDIIFFTIAYNPIFGDAVSVVGHRENPSLPAYYTSSKDDELYKRFLIWNTGQAIPLDPDSPNLTIVSNRLVKAQAIVDNLPSWSVVGGKFDAMLADANAATNLAQAKAVLIELIKTQKKMARILYWEVKNTEE